MKMHMRSLVSIRKKANDRAKITQGLNVHLVLAVSKLVTRSANAFGNGALDELAPAFELEPGLGYCPCCC
jgi:hypothetical protein